MSSFLCFAYGSNMSTERLRERVKTCSALGVAKLPGYTLRFHKRSKFGSGKCDAYHTGDDRDFVLGVLFEIPSAQREALDRFEGAGLGYDAVQRKVICADGRVVEALAYIAAENAIDPALRPTTEYRNYVEAGAIEHGLPEAYIETFIRSAEVE